MAKMKHAAKAMRMMQVPRMTPTRVSLSSGKTFVMYQLRLTLVMVRPIEP